MVTGPSFNFHQCWQEQRIEKSHDQVLNTCAVFLVWLLRIKNSQSFSFHSAYTRQARLSLSSSKGRSGASTRSGANTYHKYRDFFPMALR